MLKRTKSGHFALYFSDKMHLSRSKRLNANRPNAKRSGRKFLVFFFSGSRRKLVPSYDKCRVLHPWEKIGQLLFAKICNCNVAEAVSIETKLRCHASRVISFVIAFQRSRASSLDIPRKLDSCKQCQSRYLAQWRRFLLSRFPIINLSCHFKHCRLSFDFCTISFLLISIAWESLEWQKWNRQFDKVDKGEKCSDTRARV